MEANFFGSDGTTRRQEILDGDIRNVKTALFVEGVTRRLATISGAIDFLIDKNFRAVEFPYANYRLLVEVSELPSADAPQYGSRPRRIVVSSTELGALDGQPVVVRDLTVADAGPKDHVFQLRDYEHIVTSEGVSRTSRFREIDGRSTFFSHNARELLPEVNDVAEIAQYAVDLVHTDR